MLKRTMTYTDFNDVEKTEDFYFNLTTAEVAEMEITTEGGLTNMLQKIVAEKDNKQIIGVFKDLILKAYGEKSLDGKRFIKNQEVRDGFAQTQAYSDLFMELASDTNAAIAFVNGIVPLVPNKKPYEVQLP